MDLQEERASPRGQSPNPLYFHVQEDMSGEAETLTFLHSGHACSWEEDLSHQLPAAHPENHPNCPFHLRSFSRALPALFSLSTF